MTIYPQSDFEIKHLRTTKPARKHFWEVAKKPYWRIAARSVWHVQGTGGKRDVLNWND